MKRYQRGILVQFSNTPRDASLMQILDASRLPGRATSTQGSTAIYLGKNIAGAKENLRVVSLVFDKQVFDKRAAGNKFNSSPLSPFERSSLPRRWRPLLGSFMSGYSLYCVRSRTKSVSPRVRASLRAGCVKNAVKRSAFIVTCYVGRIA